MSFVKRNTLDSSDELALAPILEWEVCGSLQADLETQKLEVGGCLESPCREQTTTQRSCAVEACEILSL